MDEGSVVEDNKAVVDRMPGKIKVMTCEPSAGLVDCLVFDNRIDFYMELARLESRSNFKFFTGNTGRMRINYAREAMAEAAIVQGMDYILMIDDDQIVPKEMFERLYKTMQDQKADIVAPMVTQRIHPFKPVMWKHSHFKSDDGKKSVSCDFIDAYEPDTIVSADAVGFGVVLIDVNLLKKIALPRFFSNKNFVEDIWFCMRAKGQAGAKIVVDTSIKVGHLRSPEVATEWDYVKANGLEKKFEKIYGHLNKKVSIDGLNEKPSQNGKVPVAA